MTVRYEVEKNESVGRYTVASCDLKPGDVILLEEPFVVGPKSTTVPVCLGCFRPVDCSYVCQKCSWPLCGNQCESLPYHTPECQIFSNVKAKFQKPPDLTKYTPQYDCITPLRVLLAAESDKKRWNEEIKIMEAHNDARRETPYWANEHNNVVRFLRERCKLDRFSEDMIHTVCGILEVNCFEVRSSNGHRGRGLFPQYAIMSHSCVHNTCPRIIPSQNFKLIVRASVAIKKGGELFSSYTHSLMPTMVRRESLLDSKYFHCACSRCSDPTELNTHMSSLKCTKCGDGIIISNDSLDANASWSCSICDKKLPGAQVQLICRRIQAEIDVATGRKRIEERIDALEKLMRQYKNVLHSNHAFLTNLRHTLAELYGRADGLIFQYLPDDLLRRKIEFCRQILSVLDVIEPGFTRIRGMLLFELHVPMLMLAQNRFQYGEIDGEALRVELEEVAGVLEEAVTILSLEDPSVVEGMIAEMGKEAKQQLAASIEALPQ